MLIEFIFSLFAFFLEAALKISLILLLLAGCRFINSRVPEPPKSPSKLWRALKAFWAVLKAEL